MAGKLGLISEYQIGNTNWKVYGDYGYTFKIKKNNKPYKNHNGDTFESMSEAEINILISYAVEDEG